MLSFAVGFGVYLIFLAVVVTVVMIFSIVAA
jgi:hypothetical protein